MSRLSLQWAHGSVPKMNEPSPSSSHLLDDLDNSVPGTGGSGFIDLVEYVLLTRGMALGATGELGWANAHLQTAAGGKHKPGNGIWAPGPTRNVSHVVCCDSRGSGAFHLGISPRSDELLPTASFPLWLLLCLSPQLMWPFLIPGSVLDSYPLIFYFLLSENRKELLALESENWLPPVLRLLKAFCTFAHSKMREENTTKIYLEQHKKNCPHDPGKDGNVSSWNGLQTIKIMNRWTVPVGLSAACACCSKCWPPCSVKIRIPAAFVDRNDVVRNDVLITRSL